MKKYSDNSYVEKSPLFELQMHIDLFVSLLWESFATERCIAGISSMVVYGKNEWHTKATFTTFGWRYMDELLALFGKKMAIAIKGPLFWLLSGKGLGECCGAEGSRFKSRWKFV